MRRRRPRKCEIKEGRDSNSGPTEIALVESKDSKEIGSDGLPLRRGVDRQVTQCQKRGVNTMEEKKEGKQQK